MNEPRRLLEGEDPTSALLRAASHDRPPDASRLRLLTALDPSSPLVATATVQLITLTRATLTRWLLLSALAGGAVVGGAMALLGPLHWRPLSTTPVVPAPSAPVAVVQPTLPLPPPSASPVVALTPPAPSSSLAALSSAAPRPATEAHPGRARFHAPPEPEPDPTPEPLYIPDLPTPPRPPPPSSKPPGLAEEVTLLDQARNALMTGDPATTLQRLDTYETTFSRGLLAPEASALRIRALLASGQRAQASAQLQAFQVRFPRSPLTPGLHKQLEASGKK